MIILGGIILPDDLLIENEIEQQYVLATTETTIDGGEVLFWQQNKAGRSFDLVAGEDFGWLTRAMVESLQGLASTPQIFELNYHGEIKAVRFRHEDPPVLELQPLNPIADAKEREKYYGRIKLKEA